MKQHKDIKVGQIWRSFINEYVIIKRVGFIYIEYEMITRGHIAGSYVYDGFLMNHELIQ